MFELMLMRHAKSDWHSNKSDIDRPLNTRGSRDALNMGVYLSKMNLVPDKIIVSAARRTQETAELLLNNLDVPEQNIIVDKALYLADRVALGEAIENYANDNQRTLLLAHNPGMDDLVSYLSSAPPALSDSGKLMTTCAVASFTLESFEALAEPGLAELHGLIRPNEVTGTKN